MTVFENQHAALSVQHSEAVVKHRAFNAQHSVRALKHWAYSGQHPAKDSAKPGKRSRA